MITEHTYISEFNILPNGIINVRKTIEFRRNGVVVAQEPPWRCALLPNDPQATAVLGDEPYYLSLAQQAWASLPQE